MAPCMTSILAFSVSHQIEKYGAYAGFAAVVGLAILSLLYFAQAREVKRLREWAGRAPERTNELQDRVQADAQRRLVAAPVPGAVPAAARTTSAPATPAGGASPPAAGGVGAVSPATAAAAGAGTASGAAGAGTPAGPPTTVAPIANGRPGEPLKLPATAATTGRVAAAASPPGDERRSWRRLAPVLAAAGALAVIAVVLVVVLTSGGGSGGEKASGTTPTAGRTPTATSSAPARSTPVPAAKPATYKVAVLNGTAVPGLARNVANRLGDKGWSQIPTVTNAADRNRVQTIVEYAPNHRAEALAVAKAVGVAPADVQAMTAATRTTAGTDSWVVVTVGNDQNEQPQQ